MPAASTGWLGRGIDREFNAGTDLPALNLGHGVRPLALAGQVKVYAAGID